MKQFPTYLNKIKVIIFNALQYKTQYLRNNLFFIFCFFWKTNLLLLRNNENKSNFKNRLRTISSKKFSCRCKCNQTDFSKVKQSSMVKSSSSSSSGLKLKDFFTDLSLTNSYFILAVWCKIKPTFKSRFLS